MQFRGISRKLNILTFSVFYLIEIFIRRGTFCWKLKTSPELDQWFQSFSNWKILKTIENKTKIHSFFWQYLKMNAPDFRLIPLDCNTYVTETAIFDQFEESIHSHFVQSISNSWSITFKTQSMHLFFVLVGWWRICTLFNIIFNTSHFRTSNIENWYNK